MWIPTDIEIYNFKSIVYQKFKFKKGAFLIQGINETDEGQKSNGSGKSAFRESYCYALGIPTFASVGTDLINNDAKSCKVVLWHHNTLTKQDLRVIRETPKIGSSILKISLFEDGKETDLKDKFSSVTKGNKLIIDLIGINKEDLQSFFIISKEKYKSFFSSSDTAKKELSGRFSGFDSIKGVGDIVEADSKKIQDKLNIVEKEISSLNGKLEAYKEQLEAEKNIDVEDVKKEKKDGINNKIADCNKNIKGYNTNIEANNKIIISTQSNLKTSQKRIKEKQQEAKELQEKVNKLKKKLKTQKEKVSTKELEEQIKQIKEIKNEGVESKKTAEGAVKKFEKTIKPQNSIQKKMQNIVAGKITCPKCSHEFILDSDISLEEAKQTLIDAKDAVEKIEKKIDKKEKRITGLDNDISQLKEMIEETQNEISKLTEKEFKISKSILSLKQKEISIHSKITEYNGIIETYKLTIDTLLNKNIDLQRYIDFDSNLILALNKKLIKINNEVFETKQKDFEIKIKNIEEKILTQEEKKESLGDEIFKIEQWILRFKKFYSYLANKSLSVIEGYINMYLKEWKTNLSVKIEGYRILKTGKLRERITPIIYRNGIKEGSGNYKKFSSGERGKIDYAAVLTHQDLINNKAITGGLNLSWTDETTSEIDSLGLENLVASLKNLDRCCLVTSHVTHEKVHENIITIKKTNGISKIV